VRDAAAEQQQPFVGAALDHGLAERPVGLAGVALLDEFQADHQAGTADVADRASRAAANSPPVSSAALPRSPRGPLADLLGDGEAGRAGDGIPP
jgi:hypothetical protein